MRGVLSLILATTRTNAYRPVDDIPGGPLRPVIVFKLDPSQVPDLPLPRPMFEIFVCSPRVEGVHLRGAASPVVGCAGAIAGRTSGPRFSG